ncbi:unnamed protein product, partial [marine sediment metagenome]
MGQVEDFIARAKESQLRNNERIDAAVRQQQFKLSEQGKARREQTRQRSEALISKGRALEGQRQEAEKSEAQYRQRRPQVRPSNLPRVPAQQMGEIDEGSVRGEGLSSSSNVIQNQPQPGAGSSGDAGDQGGALASGTPGTVSNSVTENRLGRYVNIGPFGGRGPDRQQTSTQTRQDQDLMQAEVDSLAQSFSSADGVQSTGKLQQLQRTYSAQNPEFMQTVVLRAQAQYEAKESKWRQEKRPAEAQAEAYNWG